MLLATDLALGGRTKEKDEKYRERAYPVVSDNEESQKES